MAYGSGGWGATPWGATAGIGATLRLAWVSARNAIDTEWSEPLFVGDATMQRSALNPARWTLTAITTGALVPAVQHVETYEDGQRIRILFDADLTDAAEYAIEADAVIEDADGDLLGVPRDAEVIAPLLGFRPVTLRVPGEVRVDLRSVAGAKSVSGTLRYDETGDLANESGPEYLKKRILRRATTMPGGFFHLPGYGVAARPKSLITPARLVAYQSELRAQILREPDVLEVEVAATRLAPNVLRVAIRPTSVQGFVMPEIVTTVRVED